MVGAGQLVGVYVGRCSREGRHFDKIRALIVLCKSVADLFRGGRAGQQLIVQHDGRRHALVVVVNDGQEDRRRLEAADFGHLGDMLVLQGQPVDAGRIERLRFVGRLIIRDHLLAAAGIPGE